MFNMNTLPVNTSLTCSFQHSICPSWNLPYHCSVLLLNSEEGQWKSLTQSHSPTRHVLLYATHKGHYDTMAVMYSELDKNHDDIRCIYPYVSSERLRKETKGAFQVEYAKPCLINKKSNERLFVTISSDNCIIDLRKINYMKYLSSIGAIDSVSEVHISPNCVLINLEYDDERSNEKLYKQFHHAITENIQFNVYMADNKDLNCCYHSVVLKTKKKETEQHFKASSHNQHSYFSHDPFTSMIVPKQEILSPSTSFSSITTSSSITTNSATTSTATTISPSTSTPHKEKKKLKKPKKVVDHAPIMITDTHLEKVKKGQDTRTTFMIRNIPNKYTQKMLMDCINATHANTYDFLYLRIDFQNKCNVGYAFINFIDPKSVISFAQERLGKKWEHFNSDKRCALSYANIQGKTALIKKFKNSQVMSEDVAYRPKIFYSSGPNKGKEQEFPSLERKSRR